jgi:glycosyltransferase involved in cell wall biosynthesis
MTKLLLIYDVPNWACHSACRAIKRQLEIHAPGEFDCTLLRASPANQAGLKAYDLVFSTLHYHLAEAHHPRSITQVSSYSYWIRKDWPGGWPHLRQWQYVIAKSKDIFAKLTPEDHDRIELLYHPFDHIHWSPGPSPAHSAFRVGYAGHRDQSLKGLKLIRKGVAEVPGTELDIRTYEEKRVPFEEMPAFYRSLDAYVCMSQASQEAGPRPAIEAGLCGIPIITTKAGQIGEMIEDGVNGLVIDRTPESLIDALKRLKGDPKLHARLASCVRESFMDKWIMEVGKSYVEYFRKILAAPPPPMVSPRVLKETPPPPRKKK